MICDCNLKCFEFEKLHFVDGEYIKTKVYRCGYNVDNKKKKKCDFKQEVFISNFTPVYKENISKNYKQNEKNLVNDLYKYIDRFENFNDERTRYIASSHINYIVSLMGYKCFLKDKETISELKIRLKGNPDKSIITPQKTTNILDIPNELRTKKSTKTEKKIKEAKKSKETKNIRRKLKKDVFVDEEDNLENYNDLEQDKDADSKDCSDDDEDSKTTSSSESDLDEDPFDQNEEDSDIENYNSDGGNFSD